MKPVYFGIVLHWDWNQNTVQKLRTLCTEIENTAYENTVYGNCIGILDCDWNCWNCVGIVISE